MSHTVYGDSIKVYDIVFTTNGSGDATESVNIDGVLVRAAVVMDDTSKSVSWCTFEDASGVETGAFALNGVASRHLALFGDYTLNIVGSASASGRLKLYVR